MIAKNRKVSDRVRMALGVLNGLGSRERVQRKRGLPHRDAYMRAFMEINENEKNA